MHKQYDQAYFDRWYREGGIGDRARLARTVALAVATAEYHLERPIRTVLDVGAGEAAWRAPRLKLRPGLHYLSTKELDRGLPGLAELCGGVAFRETFTREDRAVGDEHDFQQRPAAFYRKRFDAVGFTQAGSHLWLSPALRARATALEIAG